MKKIVVMQESPSMQALHRCAARRGLFMGIFMFVWTIKLAFAQTENELGKYMPKPALHLVSVGSNCLYPLCRKI